MKIKFAPARPATQSTIKPRYNFSLKTGVGGERVGFVNLLFSLGAKDFADYEDNLEAKFAEGELLVGVGHHPHRGDLVALIADSTERIIGYVESSMDPKEIASNFDSYHIFGWSSEDLPESE